MPMSAWTMRAPTSLTPKTANPAALSTYMSGGHTSRNCALSIRPLVLPTRLRPSQPTMSPCSSRVFPRAAAVASSCHSAA